MNPQDSQLFHLTKQFVYFVSLDKMQIFFQNALSILFLFYLFRTFEVKISNLFLLYFLARKKGWPASILISLKPSSESSSTIQAFIFFTKLIQYEINNNFNLFQMQQQQQQQKDLRLLYPHKNLPEYLKAFTEAQTNNDCNFITGYKSFITAENTWGLLKNQAEDYCTRTFSFPFKGKFQQLKAVIAEKSENREQCELISSSVVITQKIDPIKVQKIQPQNIEALVKSISRENSEYENFEEIAINLFQNCFLTYYDYMETVGWYLQPRRAKRSILNASEKIAQDYNTKCLVGEKMFQVPKYNPETGNWDEIKENISLKLRKQEKQ